MERVIKVGSTTFERSGDRELVATRVIKAPRSLVWEAHTNPQLVRHWMLGTDGSSMPICEMDLRPGGKWHFLWKEADGSTMEMRGEFREIRPPDRLVQTEAWGAEWPESLNTLVLEESDGATTLTTTVVYASQEVREKAIGTGMPDGWSAAYDHLEEMLKTRGAGATVEGERPGASPPG